MFKFRKIIELSLPSTLAIIAAETMNVLMFRYSPISKSMMFLIGWQLLQAFMGFFFGYISDKNYRKKILIISQIFGVIVGAVLYFLHFKIWKSL